jgi:hypothetical protein
VAGPLFRFMVWLPGFYSVVLLRDQDGLRSRGRVPLSLVAGDVVRVRVAQVPLFRTDKSATWTMIRISRRLVVLCVIGGYTYRWKVMVGVEGS